MKVVISGVSGLVGTALRANLTAGGHDVLALSRRASLPPLTTITWDIENGRFDASLLEGVDVVVHLAGEPVAQRWSEKTKKAIRQSRVRGTKLLVEGLKSLRQKPKLLLSASAVGFYGDGEDRELDETSPPGEGFLPEVCQEWETAALDAMGLGMRAVCLRTGIVLSTKGGALRKMLLPFRLGLGGPLSTGRQWMPWIHIDDLVGAMRFIMEKEDLMGVVNGTSPNPVTNRNFTKGLGRVLRRPTLFPIPEFGLKLLFGEMAQILLEGQKVKPQKLQAAGFTFRHPELEEALSDILANRK
ncbi:MAG: TIGR01777 family protein [Acidobacteria bacterium]|nr:MAG: TIGR01777 family protein [Acidobacteriota bacterium]